MRSPCDPPKFDEKDWSQFDFGHWHMDGVSYEETEKAISELAAQFFQSEEWSSRFRYTLPGLKTAVGQTYEAEVRSLQEERETAAIEFKERIEAAQHRVQQVRQSNESAASPVILTPRPETFQLAVRVVESKTAVGLPAMNVRLLHPKEQAKVLQETTTDQDGNAVFALAPDTAKEYDNVNVGLQVLAPAGKPIETQKAAVCVRLNGAETKIVTVRDSPEIKEPKKAAIAAQAARTEGQKRLLARVDSLKSEQAERLRDINCRLNDLETLIGQLREDGETPAKTQAERAEPEAPPGDEPGEEDKKTAMSKKRPAERKKTSRKNR
jgi:hypothetical protein